MIPGRCVCGEVSESLRSDGPCYRCALRARREWAAVVAAFDGAPQVVRACSPTGQRRPIWVVAGPPPELRRYAAGGAAAVVAACSSGGWRRVWRGPKGNRERAWLLVPIDRYEAQAALAAALALVPNVEADPQRSRPFEPDPHGQS